MRDWAEGVGEAKERGGGDRAFPFKPAWLPSLGDFFSGRTISVSIKGLQIRWSSLTMAVSSRDVAASFCVRETIEGAFWDIEARDPGREVRAFTDGEATEVGSGTPAA